MAQVVWTEPALNDLDAIADYIAVQNVSAARELVRRIWEHVGLLAEHPESGSRPSELARGGRYRQLIDPPCRVLYRYDGEHVLILHVMRSEQLLRHSKLKRRSR